MKKDENISLTDVEWRVMRALWALHEPSLGQILTDAGRASFKEPEADFRFKPVDLLLQRR
jgi:predicted transcriptional regulator